MATPFFEHATPEEHFAAVNDADMNVQMAIIEREIAMVESAYNLNIALAEYKVMTEGGTYDDLQRLYQEATEQKAKDNEGIFQRILNLIGSIFQAVADLFTGKRRKDLEDYANSDEAKNTNVDRGIDLNKADESLNIVQRMFKKLSDGIKGNKDSKGLADDMDSEGNKLLEVGGKIIATTATTITLSSLLNLIMNHGDFVVNMQKEVRERVNEAKDNNKTTFFPAMRGFFVTVGKFFQGGICQIVDIASKTTSRAAILLKGVKAALQGVPNSMSSAFAEIKDERSESRSKAYQSQIEEWEKTLEDAKAAGDDKLVKTAEKRLESLKAKKTKVDEARKEREYKFNFKDLDEAKEKIKELEEEVKKIKNATPVDDEALDKAEDMLSDARAEAKEIEDHGDKDAKSSDDKGDDKTEDDSKSSNSDWTPSGKNRNKSGRDEIDALIDIIDDIDSNGPTKEKVKDLKKAHDTVMKWAKDHDLTKGGYYIVNKEPENLDGLRGDAKAKAQLQIDLYKNNADTRKAYSEAIKDANEIETKFQKMESSQQSIERYGTDVTENDKTISTADLIDKIKKGEKVATFEICRDKGISGDKLTKLINDIKNEINDPARTLDALKKSGASQKDINIRSSALDRLNKSLSNLQTHEKGTSAASASITDLLNKAKAAEDRGDNEEAERLRKEADNLKRSSGAEELDTNNPRIKEIQEISKTTVKGKSASFNDIINKIKNVKNYAMGSATNAEKTAVADAVVTLVKASERSISTELKVQRVKQVVGAIETSGNKTINPADKTFLSECKNTADNIKQVLEGWKTDLAAYKTKDTSAGDVAADILNKVVDPFINTAFKTKSGVDVLNMQVKANNGPAQKGTQNEASALTRVQQAASQFFGFVNEPDKNDPKKPVGITWADVYNGANNPLQTPSGVTNAAGINAEEVKAKFNALKTAFDNLLTNKGPAYKGVKATMSNNNKSIKLALEYAQVFGLDIFDHMPITESCEDVDLSQYDTDVNDILDDMTNI